MKNIEEIGVTEKVDVIFLREYGKDVSRRIDEVAIEEPLHILINKEHYATILCTPSNQEALVIGNMLSEGLIHNFDEVAEIKAEKGGIYQVRLQASIEISKRLELSSSFKRLILSSCGSVNLWPFSKIMDRINIPKVEDHTKFDPHLINQNIKNLNNLATTYHKTHGVHAAALYDSKGMLFAFAEDIGRHNAVDKVIGLAIQAKKRFDGTMIVSTGRLTGDIVLKAARMKIPLIASMTAAIDSGIEVAKKTGITLVGFVLGDKLTIYNSQERILL